MDRLVADHFPVKSTDLSESNSYFKDYVAAIDRVGIQEKNNPKQWKLRLPRILSAGYHVFIGHNIIVHVYNKKITVKAVNCSGDG